MNIIKVLQINSGEKFGGISAIILNLYRNIDHSKLIFDFVAPGKSSFSAYEKEIQEYGGNIIELRSTGGMFIRKLKLTFRLYKLIKKNKYQIIHINSGSIFFNLHVALIAKIAGIPVRIIHSHNAGNDSRLRVILGNSVKLLIPLVATDFFSCSNKAAKFMFTDGQIKSTHYHQINNGIDLSKVQFNEKKRKEYRKNLHLDNNLVIFHAGRLSEQKNQRRLLYVFKEVLKKHPKSKLVIAGAGQLVDSLKSLSHVLKIEDSVIFLGMRRDIYSLMSMSDVFVLTSFYEGLPVVGVEAQGNGLPCVFSDSITKELNMKGSSNSFLSLANTDVDWANEIIELGTKIYDRSKGAQIVRDAGYSIKDVAANLQSVYLEISKETN